MEILALVAAATLGLFILWLIFGFQSSHPPVDETSSKDRLLATLVHQLNGVHQHDEPILNRILALGTDGIPTLLEELVRRRRDDEARHAQVMSSIEDVIVHFGIAGIPRLCQQLARLQGSSPLSPHVFRILDRLGPNGAIAVMQYGLSHDGLKSDLHRYTKNINSAGLVTILKSAEDEDLTDALNVCAARLNESADALDGLWTNSAPHRRVLILRWLQEWIPICREDFILKGLNDVSQTVRLEATRLARLVPSPAFIAPLKELMTMSRQCRVAAVHALCAHDVQETFKLLTRAATDPVPDVAIPALIRVVVHCQSLGSGTWQLGESFKDTPLEIIRFQELSSPSEIPLDLLLATLNSKSRAHVYASAHLLALKSRHDPRARERLIRMADAHSLEERCLAVHALAMVGDRTASDLLVRVLRSIDSPEHRLLLQRAAQFIGQSAVSMLARRIGGSDESGVRIALAVVRTLAYADAVPSMLHALEENCQEDVYVQMSNTLYVGDVDVKAEVEQALTQSEQGLLVPALRYKTDFPKASDLPLIVELYEHHPALRPLILNILEGFGEQAVIALESRIDRGGDDLDLLPLESRLVLMKACLHFTQDESCELSTSDAREYDQSH